jgi:hypothetical protein
MLFNSLFTRKDVILNETADILREAQAEFVNIRQHLPDQQELALTEMLDE